MKALLVLLFLSFTTLSVAPAQAQAAVAVVDNTALAQWSERLNGLKKQIETAVEGLKVLNMMVNGINVISKFMQDQVDAIGRLGKIHLPFLNTVKLAQRLQKDIKCLMTDLSKLMPSVDFRDLDFGSICNARASYQDLFWLDPEEARKLDHKTLNQIRNKIDKRRNALAKTASASGLATAHIMSTQTSTITATAIDELERNVREGQSIQERLIAIGQGIVLQNRQAAQLNTMTAEILRIQATMLMLQSTTSVDDTVLAGAPAPTVGRPASTPVPVPGVTP